MKTKILAVIPARYSSSRFPAKMLYDIEGIPMIKRTYNQVVKSKYIDKAIVATDNILIYDYCKSENINVIMTNEAHNSGTERCIEVAETNKKDYTHIINIQGDEPFINPNQINELAQILHKFPKIQILTQIKKAKEINQITDPNNVKVVFGKTDIEQLNKVLYFSRSPIPYIRDVESNKWLEYSDFYLHIGIYAYNIDILLNENFISKSNNKLELNEKLEQLNWLENGKEIMAQITDYESISIDTKEDLNKIKNYL